MSVGFYKTSSDDCQLPDVDHLIVTIALPAGSDLLQKQILQSLPLHLGRFGIHHSGRNMPFESLRMQEKLNARKEREL